LPVLASAVFDLVGQISAATSVQGVWSAYMGAARQAGFDYGIAAFDFDGSDLSAFTFADSMPPGWVANYSSEGYKQCDPLARRNRTEQTAFSWERGEWEGVIDSGERRWRDDNIASGVWNGLTIPDYSGGRLKIITLCGTAPDLHPHDRIALHIAGFEMMQRVRELGVGPPDAKLPPLSPRERECLKWVAAGKTDWEIGEILSLSEKTVNIYVERAKHSWRCRRAPRPSRRRCAAGLSRRCRVSTLHAESAPGGMIGGARRTEGTGHEPVEQAGQGSAERGDGPHRGCPAALFLPDAGKRDCRLLRFPQGR
jgi:LuxR family quorum sensing-dependent transcriptional regulator